MTTDNQQWTLKGNFLSGVVLNTGSETIRLTPSIKWYEIVLSILPFILIMMWGNIVALCEIVPIVGGAIGGAVSAVCCLLNLFIIKSVRQIWLKVIISIAFLGVAFLLCYLIAIPILAALS